MLTYTPGDTLAHRLDPRTKLAFQIGFATAAVMHPTPAGLAASVAIALLALATARLPVRRALGAYRVVLVVLAFGPLIGGVTLGDPWFRVDPAVDSLFAVLRIVPILLVSAAFLHSTSVRETRAAIQRTVPGRPGQLLGIGVGLTVRFVPVVRADVRRHREAIAARGGNARSLRDRARRLAALSVTSVLRRADTIAVALRARCFAYNPTLPPLSFRAIDWPVLGLAAALAVSPLVVG